MGRHSKQRQSAIDRWKKQTPQPTKVFRFPRPKAVHKSSSHTTPRSTLCMRNNRLKEIAERIHGTDGSTYGLTKLLHQHYPHIVKSIAKQALLNLKTTMLGSGQQKQLFWDCIAARMEAKISVRGWLNLRKRLANEYNKTTGLFSQRTFPGTNILHFLFIYYFIN